MRHIAGLGIPGLRVLRGGYSAIGPGTRLRSHCGVTNSQLKFHLGLVVPHAPGTAETPCATLTVGGITHPWRRGAVLFFDDSWVHSVHNACGSERVVFQLVIRHPDVQPTGNEVGVFGSCAGH